MSEQYAEHSEQEENAVAVAVPSTGKRLREAREAAGLSREEVSTRLRLRLDLIRALEDDDYAALPPATFVSGYLRSYARLLGIPPEPLLAGSERRESEPSLVSPVMPPRQRRSSDLPVKAVTYLVFLSMLLLLVAWWLARRPQVDVPQQEAPSLVSPGGTVELQLPPAADNAAGQEQSAPLEPAAGETAVVVEQPAPLPTLVTVAEAEIQLEATQAECWVEIKDASGKQIMYELIKQGTTRTVRGQAPFDVFLGYAPGVTVYYRGQVFDHTKYQRKEVARFKLGQKSDNVAHSE